MNRDEIWETMKRDGSTVYGKPILDAFLELTTALEGRHYNELSNAKRALLTPQIRLNMAATPEEAKRAVKEGAEDFRQAAYQMGKNGFREALEWVLARKTINRGEVVLWAFSGAAAGGHRQIMEWIMGMGRGSYDPDNALYSAAQNGQIETAKWLASNGASDFESALNGAAQGGQVEVAAWALENYDGGCSYALLLASASGHLEMVKWLIDTGRVTKDDKDEAMREAAAYGQNEVVQWLADNHSKKYRRSFEAAVVNKHEDTVRLLIRYLKDLDTALVFCAERGELQLVKMVAEAGAKDFEKALERSIPYGRNSAYRAPVAKWLIDSGKVDLRTALAHASVMQNRPLVDYIRDRMGGR